MIIEDIPKKKNGTPYLSHKVLCKCDDCEKQFERFVFAALKDARFCKSCATTNNNKSRDPSIHIKMIEQAAKTWRGKTREEVCGKEKAQAASKSQSLKTSGENNPNFGGKYSRGFADNPLGGKWEDRFGMEEANRRKIATSKRISGSGNPMYGKPSPKKSGNGISGWWKDSLYFRSLLELAFIIKCEKEGICLESAERKEFRFEYDFHGAKRTYTPDFVDTKGILYEVKPTKLLAAKQVQAKMKAAPNVVMITDEMISRPTYSQLRLLMDIGYVKIDKTKLHRIKENAT